MHEKVNQIAIHFKSGFIIASRRTRSMNYVNEIFALKGFSYWLKYVIKQQKRCTTLYLKRGT